MKTTFIVERTIHNENFSPIKTEKARMEFDKWIPAISYRSDYINKIRAEYGDIQVFPEQTIGDASVIYVVVERGNKTADFKLSCI